MINLYSNLDELSAASAEFFCRAAEEAISQRNVFRVTLSGGSTPRRLYELLAQRSLPWGNIEFYWGDERNVLPTDDQSNFRMVREALLDHLPSASVHAFPVPVDPNQPRETALAYEATLRRTFPAAAWPTWDLALLGMGDDAHTASLFPETDAINETDRWFVENYVAKFGHYRYTLTAPAINSARQRVFLVAGAGKRSALARVLNASDRQPNHLPSQLIEAPIWFATTDAWPVNGTT